MKNFLGKNILFFAPSFFDYEIEIKNKLEEYGANIDYYDERMNPNTIEKALIRVRKELLEKKINKYYKKIIENSSQKVYDYVFFLSPETITRRLLVELKSKQKKAKFILYMYDSLENKKNVTQLLDLFDDMYTFDKNDSLNYNTAFKFKPLFYLDEYKKVSGVKSKIKYDLIFIGTIHSDRYKIISQVKSELLEKRFSVYFFMYFPSKLIYFLRKMFDKSYKKANINDFSFKPLKKEEIIRLLSNSNVVLDIQHPNQIGLTMRTIEVLGMKRKLITTNKDICNYDFYNKVNILIIDRENPLIDEEFFKTKYTDIDKKIYENYSIDSWLFEIFS